MKQEVGGNMTVGLVMDTEVMVLSSGHRIGTAVDIEG
jgi:hypothetical protein